MQIKMREARDLFRGLLGCSGFRAGKVAALALATPGEGAEAREGEDMRAAGAAKENEAKVENEKQNHGADHGQGAGVAASSGQGVEKDHGED
jgi:hypothetical protein